MTMWIIIMWVTIAFVTVSVFYLGTKVPELLNVAEITEWGKFKQFSLGLLITLGFTGILVLFLDFINAIICIMYMAMIWAFCDFAFAILEKYTNIIIEHHYIGWIALVLSVIVLNIGWYLDHRVWQTDYEITTNKKISNLKVAMLADAHIGTTFDDTGFAEHLSVIQAQNPDIILIVGDYVDDGTSKEQMINATRALGQMKTKYGIYFVFGNHDKGYYGAEHRGFGAADLYRELSENNIKVLRDENVLIDDLFYIIGRKDYSAVNEKRGGRKSISELVKNLDNNKYMIVMDHQPVEFNQDVAAKVDLVLCGHTHGGQLFPFNQVGKLIGANDMVYGHKKIQDTNFIVTSGISDWAIKFKTGTKSEFVIINIKNKNN